jgi:transposase
MCSAPCARIVVASFRSEPEWEDNVTRPYSIGFKQKMIQRLIGKDAVSANRLARETGLHQQSLSRWLEEARNLPLVSSDDGGRRDWTVEQKARVLAEGAKLSGEQLNAYLAREGVKLAEFERWRVALEENGQGSVAASRRIRKLERALARKDRALAEAAALLVLKKTVADLYPDEDDDIDEPSAN